MNEKDTFPRLMLVKKFFKVRMTVCGDIAAKCKQITSTHNQHTELAY